MLLFLHHFTILWLLLQIITYCKGTIHGSLFLSVSRNITKSTFPVAIKLEEISDVILVKCPGKYYKHSNARDNFALIDSLWSPNSTSSIEKPIYVWTTLSHRASGYSIVTCGELGIRRFDNSLITYDWSYQFNWLSKPKPFEIAKREKISKTLPLSNNCNDNPAKVVKFTRDKQGNMKRLNINNADLKEADEIPHVNKLYYFFVVPEENSTLVHVPPCEIVKSS
ncbi:Hypothetical protein SRAE_X000248800 [Strongyloides ratti]|uniref:DUF7585 domain-containing protein n=1 Tax=Strongyloides ratti TaxID=34506 RepID=A0A090KY74_STRRB|nr:Hypothetical protein SRAE_X000248800 [Strongyloides ratti]CEF60812.1 Hypothetical protein SRAE_X000248800 [Strongyloides ratti]